MVFKTIPVTFDALLFNLLLVPFFEDLVQDAMILSQTVFKCNLLAVTISKYLKRH